MRVLFFSQEPFLTTLLEGTLKTKGINLIEYSPYTLEGSHSADIDDGDESPDKLMILLNEDIKDEVSIEKIINGIHEMFNVIPVIWITSSCWTEIGREILQIQQPQFHIFDVEEHTLEDLISVIIS